MSTTTPPPNADALLTIAEIDRLMDEVVEAARLGRIKLVTPKLRYELMRARTTPTPANVAAGEYDQDFRSDFRCEFCGCKTNARLRRCCDEGYRADIGKPMSEQNQSLPPAVSAPAVTEAMVRAALPFISFESPEVEWPAQMRNALEAAERARTAPAASDPTHGNWIAADDVNRLVRELDVALNGDGAAQQASLCDIVSQVTRGGWRLVRDWPAASVGAGDTKGEGK